MFKSDNIFAFEHSCIYHTSDEYASWCLKSPTNESFVDHLVIVYLWGNSSTTDGCSHKGPVILIRKHQTNLTDLSLHVLCHHCDIVKLWRAYTSPLWKKCIYNFNREYNVYRGLAFHIHCSDVIIATMASQITSFIIVYWTVYSGTDQRKHQNSASLAFVWGIHQWPMNSPHKWPVTRKIFPFDDVIMFHSVWDLFPFTHTQWFYDFFSHRHSYL